MGEAAMVLGPSPDEHVFEVLLSRREYVDAALAKLAKRCARKGLPVLTWSWGKAYKDAPRHVERFPCSGEPECRGCVSVARIPLTLTGATPKYAGWTFLAALTHVEDETVIRSFASEVPAMYRTRGPACDHCKADRRRGETYVVRHDDGRTMQVGSTCIADFLGIKDATKIAAAAEILATACELAGDDEGGGMGGGGAYAVALVEDYLPMVAWCVRELGWISRTKARESVTPVCATADQAMTFLFSSRARELAKVELTQEDNDLAAAAAKWAEDLTDAQVDGDDYKHNLRVVARAGYVKGKLAGIAASMIVAYQRALGIERRRAERAARPPSEYVGTPGGRVTIDATLDFVTGKESDYGYTTICKFITAAGEVLTWFASGADVLRRDDVGKRYVVRATVKKHDEYNGSKQTVITRAVVTDFDADAYAAGVAEDRRKELAAKSKGGTLTAEETAELVAIKAAEKAARAAHRTEVAKHVTFETVLETVHHPMTHERVRVAGTGISVDFTSYTRTEWRTGGNVHVETAFFTVTYGDDGHSYKDFKGAKALDNARRFVAELLSESKSHADA